MLKQNVIVITGAGRGIGRSIAEACAKNEAKVVITSRTRSEIESVAAELEEKYRIPVKPVVCDVSKFENVEALVESTEKELGPIDGLVCAAGIYGAIGPIDQTPPNEWKQAIEVNLIGTYHCIHACVGAMKSRKKGRIVLFSGGGQGPIPNFSAYTSSKGAIWRLTETLGSELESFGIFVNAIAPGLVNTRFLDDLLAAGEEKVGKELYEKSLKQKEEGGISPDVAADLALYLLSSASGTLHGKTLSARWDPYSEIKDFEKYNQSDIYTVKRITDFKGNTRFH